MIKNIDKDILDFIKKYITKNGFSPSNREILENCKLKSIASVNTHLYKLKKDKKITFLNNSARTVRVV